ncbi:MAG: hypothetical protein KatS3mg024_2505 [Armatimonadota bacterium]|jgi:hypothetical protein|nr:MAG: hypothetical protein KatS3mg024_2505 [Armatimonadota bacterium]
MWPWQRVERRRSGRKEGGRWQSLMRLRRGRSEPAAPRHNPRFPESSWTAYELLATDLLDT